MKKNYMAQSGTSCHVVVKAYEFVTRLILEVLESGVQRRIWLLLANSQQWMDRLFILFPRHHFDNKTSIQWPCNMCKHLWSPLKFAILHGLQIVDHFAILNTDQKPSSGWIIWLDCQFLTQISLKKPLLQIQQSIIPIVTI